MGTSTDALNAARAFLDAGTREVPDGSNRVVGITDQGGFYPAAWCDAFVITCLRKARVDAGPQTMWVSNTMSYFRGQGRNFTEARHAAPGDLVAFEWGTTAGGYDHIGFVERSTPDGLVTIEGNVGNRVQRLFRNWVSGMAEFARPAYSSAPAIPPSVSDPNGLAVVYRIGSRGETVKQIQKIVGAYVDGVYGEQTAAAVRNWQAKLGLAVDGVWGPNTDAATKRLFQYIVATSNQPDPVLVAYLQALNHARQQVLRVGNRGGAVSIMQNLLINRGVYLRGGADGIFGPGTEAAVKQFQARNGLSQDGVVGPKTWAALVR